MDNQTEPKPLTTLTKCQIKHRRNKASKVSKRTKNLRIEIDDLKSQMDDIEDKIARAFNSSSSRFKRKRIRSMKREATKIAEKLRESESTLESLEAKAQVITPTLKPNKRIKNKIADLNREIRRAEGKMKRNLIAKRDVLQSQLADLTQHLSPCLIEGAFGGAYSRYRIDGVERMDSDTQFSKTRGIISDLLKRESVCRAVRSQTTTWIRFIKDDEQVECFKWAVIAALKWREIEHNVQRISKLRRHDDLDWDALTFQYQPVTLKDLNLKMGLV